MQFQLGSVKLNSAADSASITVMIFNEAIAAAGELQSTISTLQAENERMATERANALKVHIIQDNTCIVSVEY